MADRGERPSLAEDIERVAERAFREGEAEMAAGLQMYALHLRAADALRHAAPRPALRLVDAGRLA